MIDNTTIDNLKLELRKGTLVLGVLSQLHDKHYGYTLNEKLNNLGLHIDQNTLYPLLRRLEKQKILDAIWDTNGNRPRKYYTLSKDGAHVYSELLSEFNKLNSLISELTKE